MIKLDKQKTPAALLIAEERMSQIVEHNFTLEYDKQNNNDGHLIQAMKFCLTLKDSDWPQTMSLHYRDNIKKKSRNERLVIAAAFIAAELDRVRNVKSIFNSIR